MRTTATRTLLCLLLIVSLPLLTSPGSQASTFDLGGRTVNLQTRWAWRVPLELTIGYTYFQDDWYDPDATLAAHIEKVEEMFNCSIEFVYPGNHHQAIEHLQTGIMAGDTPFEFFHVPHFEMDMLAADGMLLALDDVIQHDAFYARYPETFRRPEESFQFGRRTYGFGSPNHVREAGGIVWNMTMFEEEGWPHLHDLYEADEWTWEAFREVATEATADTTGDGEIDRMGAGFANALENLEFIVASNNGRMIRINEDGRVEFALNESNAIEAMEYLQGLYMDGVVEDGTGGRSADRHGHAMWITWVHNVNSDIYVEHEDDFSVAPMPMGPEADDYAVPKHNLWMGVLPVTVQEPEAIIELILALWAQAEPYIEDLDAWEELFWERYARGVPDRRTLDIWRWMMQNSFVMQGRYAIRTAGQAEFWHPVIYEGRSAATAMDEFQPVVQALLDEIYGQ